LLGHLRDKLALVDQGRRCEPAQGFVDAGGAEADRVTLVMDFACASDARELSIRDDLFDVLGPDHYTLAKIESGGEIRALAFATEAREARASRRSPALPRGGDLLPPRRRAHPDRLRSSPLSGRVAAPGRTPPLALQDHHGHC